VSIDGRWRSLPGLARSLGLVIRCLVRRTLRLDPDDEVQGVVLLMEKEQI
jgi:hypothetical protein